MAQVITLAGERLFALKAQNNQQLDIDTFIFAYVPGQDSTAPIDRNEDLPPVNQRVHQQIVQQYGMLNDNAVVYSSVLDSLTGPFQFNWVGLYSAVNQTLVAIQHIPTVVKTVTEPGASGNILNRNFVIEYSGIAELTGITVDPATWQYDFNARLNGMDELTRKLAADMNGKDWFIGDGFKVVPRSTLNTFKVTAGAGYVSGLRVELAADHILTLSSYPQFVYVDAWFDGTSESVWKGHTAFTVTNTEMDDYIDVNGRNHYVFKLARITAADAVEDLRNVDGVGQKIDKLTANFNNLDSSSVKNTLERYVGLEIEESNLEQKVNYRPVQNLLSDKSVSSSLTMLFDDIKQCAYVSSIKLGKCNVDSVTPSVTLARALEMTYRGGEITGFTTNSFSYEVYVKQTENFIDNNIILNEGDSASPFININPANVSYIRVKKGVGQGKLLISYVIQKPMESINDNIIAVELIDLNDGMPDRFVDLILPQISEQTMNGFIGMKNGRGLRYSIKASEGIINIAGYGFKLGSGNLESVIKGKVNIDNLVESGRFSLPIYLNGEFDAIYINFSMYSENVSASINKVSFNYWS